MSGRLYVLGHVDSGDTVLGGDVGGVGVRVGWLDCDPSVARVWDCDCVRGGDVSFAAQDSVDGALMFRNRRARRFAEELPTERQPNGYYRVLYRGYWRWRHRVIAEEFLLRGRPVPAGCVVHHRNHVKGDDRPSNLKVMTAAAHDRHHEQYRRWQRAVHG